MTSARKKAYAALIVCELLWGASQQLVKPALHFITPAQFLFLRYLIAAPLVIPLVLHGARQSHFTFKNWMAILVTEGIGIMNLLVLYTGLKYVTSLQSSLLVNTRPVFMTIAGILFLSEREEGHEWIGLALSLLGTVFFILSPLIGKNSPDLLSFSIVGIMMILTTNVINTINNMLVKKFYPKLNKLAISGFHMWIGLTLFAVYLGSSGQLPNIEVLKIPSVLHAVLYMSIFGSVISLTLSNYGYTKIEASEASLFNYLQPLVYVPLAILWLKEESNPYQLIGMFVILFGVYWAERRPRKKHKKLRHGIPFLARYRLAEANITASIQTPRHTHYP